MLRQDPPLNLARAVRRLQRARASAAAPRAPAAAAGRRRRLWELPPRALELVLGVGLPHEALRRIARRVLRQEPRAQGHELHAGLVAECRRRSPMAEALEAELDRRHACALRQAVPLQRSEAVAGWWQLQVARDEVPAALWAALSHACCTPALETRVLGEVQMLQFKAGQAARVELARFEALIDENAVLARVLAEAQRRCSVLMADHERERQADQAEMATLRGRLRALQETLDAPARHTPGLPARAQRLAAYPPQGAPAPLANAVAKLATPALAHAMAPVSEAQPVATLQAPIAARAPAVALDQRKVLCVGGRTASVPVYRRLVEACGGRFLHHDGGEQDKLGQLDATLAAADLVICQAGCVSHNAYWRVKDHCKRTGKRCVFVETPSAAGLQRALAKVGN